MKNYNKKWVRKVTAIAVLLGALVLVSSDKFLNDSVDASSVWPCDLAAHYSSTWTCGDNLYATNTAWNNAVSTCVASANSQCSGSSDPSCWGDKFNACYTEQENAYNSRYTTYGDCLNGNTGLYYTVQFCPPEPDHCDTAVAEGNLCVDQFPYDGTMDDFTAREACFDAVPHGRGCPGFPLPY